MSIGLRIGGGVIVLIALYWMFISYDTSSKASKTNPPNPPLSTSQPIQKPTRPSSQNLTVKTEELPSPVLSQSFLKPHSTKAIQKPIITSARHILYTTFDTNHHYSFRITSDTAELNLTDSNHTSKATAPYTLKGTLMKGDEEAGNVDIIVRSSAFNDLSTLHLELSALHYDYNASMDLGFLTPLSPQTWYRVFIQIEPFRIEGIMDMPDHMFKIPSLPQYGTSTLPQSLHQIHLPNLNQTSPQAADNRSK